MNPHIVDLRKRSALLRAQAHQLEEEARALEEAERPAPKAGDHKIAPAAGSFVLGRE